MFNIRTLLKGASLTTALFIFQACYGTPSVPFEKSVTFKVVSAEDGSPLPDIAVKTKDMGEESQEWYLLGYTYDDGIAKIYTTLSGLDAALFRFESENGMFAVKDTVISDFSDIIEITLQK